jgi:hypothetical protein
MINNNAEIKFAGLRDSRIEPAQNQGSLAWGMKKM